MIFIKLFFCIFSALISHKNESKVRWNPDPKVVNTPYPGAYSVASYLPKLKNKRVALLVNQTSLLNNTHLVDTLRKNKINIVKIFSPEHGFRGQADAGEHVSSSIDSATGIPLVTLYGDKRKPGADDLKDVDIVVFDIQDIGVRFYTYIATLSLVLESCGENHKSVMILDRPNPNGYYVDGPVIEKEYFGFLGLHPVPVVYGMTIGEYGKMIMNEGWLKNKVKCNLTVIPCTQYDHTMTYEPPVKPSPNIPNLRATLLYPSTCFFEGTTCSEGRGTTLPFICFGHPKYTQGDYTFTPASIPGAKSPKLLNQKCNGYNLSLLTIDSIRSWKRINLYWLLKMYKELKDKDPFFLENNFFNKLAGNKTMMAMIKEGKSEDQIRAAWKPEINKFKMIRKKYLIYKDFE